MRAAWLAFALAASAFSILALPPAQAQERGKTFTTEYDVTRMERSRVGGSVEINVLRGTSKDDGANVVVAAPPEAKPEPQRMITNHRRRSYKTPAN